MKNTKNSPLNQDVKFDTTLHNYGKRAHLMTAKERSNYREGLGIALAFAPIPGVGIVGRALGKTLQTSARNFSSAVKQFLGKGKVATKPRLVDQYHTVDRGAIKKFNQLQQSTSGSSKVATRPINPRLVAKAKGDPSYLSIAKADKSVSQPPRKIGEFERRAAEYLNKRASKGTATADDIKQLNIYNKRTNFGQR